MANHRFVTHGSIDITVEGNIVIMDIEGPCNTEFFEQMAVKLASIKSQININNYTALVIFRNEALATSEALSYFTNYVKKIQVRAVATNLQYANAPSMTQDMCAKAYIDSEVKHDFFMDNESAILWLRDCMNAV